MMTNNSSFILFVIVSFATNNGKAFQGFPCRPASNTNHFNGRRQSSSNALSTTTTRVTTLRLSQNVQEEESSLSDVDARVLQDMLQESKLDLKTEDDIRKLLERGTVKSTVNQKEEELKAQQKAKEDSPFDSTILQTFTDTTLWKKLSQQTEDLIESAKIWMANKVEKDVQVMAALGLFAWERAVKDVARALPAAGSAAQEAARTVAQEAAKRTPFSLTDTSSYQEPPPPQPPTSSTSTSTKESLRNDLNRPADEIKDVTRAIFDILSGESVAAQSTQSRGWRTTAKAGLAASADRQRRAFTQRRKLDRRDKDLTRIATGVVDATYELQRELKAETSSAGYKTKPIRQAIAAGTAGVLTAVKETARLAAEKRDAKLALKHQAVNRTVIYSSLLEERQAIQQRLSACIDSPQTTWLSAPDELLAQETMNLSEERLREVATLMVLLRNDMSGPPAVSNPPVAVWSEDGGSMAWTPVTAQQVQELVECLRVDLRAIEELRSRVAADISFPIAEALYPEMLGLSDDNNDAPVETPLILRLDEIEASLLIPDVPTTLNGATAVEDAVEPTQPDVNQGVTQNAFFAGSFVTNGNEQETETIATNGWAAVADEEEDEEIPTNGWFGTTVPITPETSGHGVEVEEPVVMEPVEPEVMEAVLVDSAPEGPTMMKTDGAAAEVVVDDTDVLMDDYVSQYKSFVAEVVSDEDIEGAFGDAKAVKNLSEEEVQLEEAEEEPNVAIIALLRTLDVVFFVLEKSFTLVLPNTIQYCITASRRFGEIQRSGRGNKGWELLRRSADAKGRY